MEQLPKQQSEESSPPRVVSLSIARASLSRLVDEAAAGQEVVITKRGKPVARLVGLPTVKLRELGGWKGKAWISDDFDAPLPDDILDAFEGRTGDSEEGGPTD